jgi:branched-chain amino acid transport system permease protein
MNTPFGRQLDAIRTNEHRLPFLGFDPWRYKLAVFVLAATGGSAQRCAVPDAARLR